MGSRSSGGKLFFVGGWERLFRHNWFYPELFKHCDSKQGQIPWNPSFSCLKKNHRKKNEPFTVYPIKNLRLWPWNVGFDHVRMGLDQNVLWALRPPETTRENTDWVLQNDEMSWVIAFVWTCVGWWSVVSCFWHLAEHDRFVLEGRASVSATKKRMCWDWWHLWAWAGEACPNWTSIYIERSGQVS